MAQKLDWAIWGRDPSSTSVLPSPGDYTYDLYNLTDSEAIVYGHRQGDNINLVWGDPGKSDNVRFWRQSGSKDALKFEEPVAINVREGKWLVYERGRQGINLGWSDEPRFEWKFVGSKAGDPVTPFRPVGLHNAVENDILMYESRDWGINLKWYRDSGKYQELSDGIANGKDVVDFVKKWSPF